jgi:hypothetical protein
MRDARLVPWPEFAQRMLMKRPSRESHQGPCPIDPVHTDLALTARALFDPTLTARVLTDSALTECVLIDLVCRSILSTKVVPETSSGILIPIVLCVQHPRDGIEELETICTRQTLWQTERHTKRIQMRVEVREAVGRVLENDARRRR